MRARVPAECGALLYPLACQTCVRSLSQISRRKIVISRSSMKWLYVALLPVAAGFVPGKPVAARFVPGIAPMVGLRRAALRCVVTEDDVEKAVEKAEKLWADALAARKKADALSAEAEEMAQALRAQLDAAEFAAQVQKC